MKTERDQAAVEAAKLSQQVEDLRADLASMKTANKDSEKARNIVEREKAKIEGKIELLEEQLAKMKAVPPAKRE